MKNKRALIFIFSIAFLQGCFVYQADQKKVKLSSVVKHKTELKTTLSSVSIVNNQLIINGQGFSDITNVKIQGNGVDANLTVDSASDSQLVAKTTSALSLLASGTFNLIISTADAEATYPVTFTLQDGAVTAAKLNSMGATNGQVLKYNGTTWAPAYLSSSQVYKGSWNPNTNAPDDITSLGSFSSGDYYIVSTAGTFTSGVLTTSPTTFAVGDWVMFNGATWDKIVSNNLTGSGTANKIPYYTSSNVLTNSPMTVSGGSIGIGTSTPGSALDVKGAIRLSGATSGYVGLAPAAAAGATTYTLPAADGASGQMLSTDGAGGLFWTSVSASGGVLTGVTSANTDIGVANGTSAPVLTLNSGTGASQIVKLTAASKLPAVDGSLLTNLTSTNLVGAVAVANGGTGATTLGGSQSALGITIAGPLTGNTPTLGATVIADRLCASDSVGGTISCINNLPAATVKNSVSGTSGTGNLLFGTSPAIVTPVITSIVPGADFTLSQNGVSPFTSVNTGAVANTLYLKAGNVGIGTTTPTAALTVASGANAMKVVPGWNTGAGGTGTWIDLDTNGASGIGSGGVGTNAWIGYVKNATEWLNNSSPGDIAYRNTTGKLLFGTSAGNAVMAVSGSNVGIGTVAPAAAMDIAGTNTSNSQLRVGSLEFQPYALNNAFIGENTHFSAGAFKYTATGAAGLFYFQGNEGQFRFSPSGAAGANLSNGGVGNVVFKANSDGTVALGGLINNLNGNYGGATLLVGSSGNVGVGTTNPSVKLEVAGTGAAGGGNAYQRVISYSSTYSDWQGAGGISIAKSHSNTVGTLATTLSGETLGQIGFAGVNTGGVSYNQAVIDVIQSGNAIAGAGGPARMDFYVGSATGLKNTMSLNNGNVGIGTTTPSTPLHVVANAATGTATLQNSNSAGWTSFDLRNYLGTQVGGFGYGNSGAASFPDRVYLYSASKDIHFSHDLGSTIDLSVQGTTGKVGIGTSAPSEKLHVVGNLRVQGSTDCTLGNGAGGTNCSSDIRLKEHIEEIQNPLTKILSLRGVEFDWNDKSQSPGRHDIGVIAQDVEKVFPTAVIEDSQTGIKKVDYAVLVAPIIQAFKEVYKHITDLFDVTKEHSRAIASMKAENIALKKKIEAEKLAKSKEIIDLKQENAVIKARLDKIEKMLLKNK